MNYDSDSRPKRAQQFLQEKKDKAAGMKAAETKDAETYDFMGRGQEYKKLSENNASSNYDSVQRGRQASAAANETVKANDMFKGLRQSVVDQGDYYQASSRMRQAGLFGDVWNQKSPPKWVSPDEPEEIKTTYDK